MWKPKETRSSYRFRSQVGVPQPTGGDDFQPDVPHEPTILRWCLPCWLGQKSTSTCLPAFLISVLKKSWCFSPTITPYHASNLHATPPLPFSKTTRGKSHCFQGKKTWRDQNCPYHSRFQVRYTTNAYISFAENSPIVGFVGRFPNSHDDPAIRWRPAEISPDFNPLLRLNLTDHW